MLGKPTWMCTLVRLGPTFDIYYFQTTISLCSCSTKTISSTSRFKLYISRRLDKLEFMPSDPALVKISRLPSRPKYKYSPFPAALSTNPCHPHLACLGPSWLCLWSWRAAVEDRFAIRVWWVARARLGSCSRCSNGGLLLAVLCYVAWSWISPWLARCRAGKASECGAWLMLRFRFKVIMFKT